MSAVSHPQWRDGVIAAALLVLPWVLGWALVPQHHLNTTAVTILVSVTIPLSTLWLTWAALRTASRVSPADSEAGSGIITAGPNAVVADRGGTAIGQVVYQQRRGVTAKPVRLADPPPLLAGREDLLAELDTQLTASDILAPLKVALCGLGGAGKTSVALAYAHLHLAEVEVAWQFRAEDATVLAAEFGELAAQLGARGLADIRDPITSVHAVLARFAVPWLLIFDNAADPASLTAFLPPAGPGRVLITSQNPAWPGQSLDVPMLDRDIAAAFLVNRTGDQDWQAARDLADELGGLPLALEQAAAYIQATGGTLSRYLALFRQRRAELLARGEPTGYTKTVASTWTLALDRLQQTEPGAVALLRLLAFCASEAVPLRLLLQLQPRLARRLGRQVRRSLALLLRDPLAADSAIAALRRYSLVTPATDGSVSVHRLVQAVTSDLMPAKLAVEWRQAAATLIEQAIPANTALPETWPVCALLLPHAEAALADDSDGMARIAQYLRSSGSYGAARDLQRRILEAQERVLGPKHPITLNASRELARFIGSAGDPVAARDLLAELLPVEERVLGPKDMGVLITRHELARFTGEAGDPVAASDLLAELLPVDERVLGPEHPDTLTTHFNLAYWTGEAGNLAGARDLTAELLSIREGILGPEHPDTLTARGNLAGWTGLAGDPAAARDLYAELLPVEEQVMGPEHPRTLTTRLNLARWTGLAGDVAASRDLLAGLVPVLERVLGPEHPITLQASVDLADSTGNAGNPAAARDLLAKLLLVHERVLGPEHPRTLTVRHELASFTGESGDPAAARDLFAALAPALERVHGPEHPHTLSERHELARWTGLAGDPAAARDLLAEVLPVEEQILGPEHPDTLTTRGELARFAGLAGDAAAARDLLAEVLSVDERVLGPEHPFTLADRRELARWTERARRRR